MTEEKKRAFAVFFFPKERYVYIKSELTGTEFSPYVSKMNQKRWTKCWPRGFHLPWIQFRESALCFKAQLKKRDKVLRQDKTFESRTQFMDLDRLKMDKKTKKQKENCYLL